MSDIDDEQEPEVEPDEQPEAPDITIPPEWVPGVYANAAQATYNAYEVTIDFVRMDPYYNSGVVVARVSFPHTAANDFVLHLAQVLQAWAGEVMSDQGGNGNGQTFYGPDN
jgi:hypothetical protein